MGSYASQLSRKQRWMVIQYVKQHQLAGAAGSAATDSTKAGASGSSDSTAAK
jgi:hypothetical protein